MHDEVASIANRYLNDPTCDGLAEIDRHVMQASQESQWDEVGKWHRVRLRYIRFRQQRSLMARGDDYGAASRRG